jgi:photosynthetic reaction center cytochrome c subunit
MSLKNRWSGLLFAGAVAVVTAGCEVPPVDSVQHGFRGTGMVELYNPATVAEQVIANKVPELAVLPAGGAPAKTAFKNLQVLGDLDINQFTGLMVALTAWVSPKEGCSYCHVAGDLASDGIYTKVVSRRMLQMTQQINSQWQSHVVATGVTCYTCHRGQPVPANVWFADPGPKTTLGMVGSRAGQNTPAAAVGVTSLPYDPLTAFLDQANEIRITPTTSLPTGSRPVSIVDTERTYGLMVNMSKSLGVNCNYCHNSQSFANWGLSTPQRTTAWYGIRMVRELNNNYLKPLKPVFPTARLGPLGDAPKVGCATCHQGAYKPLYAAPMLKNYPALASASLHPVKAKP